MTQPGFTSLELEIKTTDLPAAVKAACNYAGLPESNANAKLVAAQIVSGVIDSQLRKEAAVSNVTIQ